MGRTTSSIVIGLTGLLGAGKGEAAKFFVAKGFNYYSLSDELREILKREGREVTRDALFRLGNELRSQYGPGYIAQLVRERMKTPAIVDSIRNPGEVDELRKDKGFVLVSVEAPQETRYRRLVSRRREGEEDLTFEEFRRKEEREVGGSETGQQLLKVAGLADFVVQNDSTLETLNARLEGLYRELLSGYNGDTVFKRPLTLVFLGRSGSGKGTQAEMLIKHLGETDVLYIVTGNLFRGLAAKDTVIGRKVAHQLKTGELPPYWLADTMWQHEMVERLVRDDQSIFFDGALRHVPEAVALEAVLEWLGRPKAIPILIDVTRDEAFKRLKLRQRADDQDAAINRRLDWYDEDVSKVVEYYENLGRLVRVDGMPAPEKVFENLLAALGLKNTP